MDPKTRVQVRRAMQAANATWIAHLNRQRRAMLDVTEAMREFRVAWDRSHRA